MHAYRWVVVALLLLAIGVTALETASVASGKMSPLDRIPSVIFSPFQRVMLGAAGFLADQWNAGLYRKERGMFENQIYSLTQQLSRLRAAQEENRVLRDLLQLRSSLTRKTVVAEILGRDPSHWFQEMTIDRGVMEGMRPDAGVVASGGAVGKIMEVAAHQARVRLLLDPNLAVPVKVLPSSSHGIAYGAEEEGYVVKYLPHDAPIKAGDLVVTSGYGHVFEKGIPVGTVTRVEPGEKALFKRAYVKPSVNFGRLEEVLVFAP